MGSIIGKSGNKYVKIADKDRRSHVYLIGKTGTGKSTLLKNMIIQDMRRGGGVAVLDPHGDLTEELLCFVPKNRTNEVVYFNPADLEFPVGLNVLEAKGEEEKQLVASSFISICRHVWGEFWGPRSEFITYNAILALMDTPGNTLLGVYRILIDEHFRRRIVANIQDPMVKMFWEKDFESYNLKFQKEIIAPVQNKIGQLLTGAPLRNIVGQSKSTIDFRFIMDSQKIFLANLSKGRIGEDRSNLLGSILVTKMYLAALGRQKEKEGERKDFFVYIDEFQNFSTDSFSAILSEARKFRLNLTLAHQYLDQLAETTKKAVFGNVGAVLAFRVGSLDAERLEKEFLPFFDREELNRQRNHELYYKKLKRGESEDPSFAQTFPPIELVGDEADPETIIKSSRLRYGRSRGEVEKKIEKWFKNL
jgi:DNA-binding transcriptional regulator GbsR (MarR family)